MPGGKVTTGRLAAQQGTVVPWRRCERSLHTGYVCISMAAVIAPVQSLTAPWPDLDPVRFLESGTDYISQPPWHLGWST